jgi:hypothetical protein
MLALTVYVIVLWVIAPLFLFLIGKMSKAIGNRRVSLIGSRFDRAVPSDKHRLRLAKGQP